MSWINPDLRKPKAAPKVATGYIIRKRVRSIRVDPKSGYNPSSCTHGYCEVIQLDPGEKMSVRLAVAFAALRIDLEKAGVTSINEPEIFPIDEKQCLVLMTGWIPQIIILNS